MNEFRSTITKNLISLAADSNHTWIQTGSKKLFKQSCYDDIWDICRRAVAVFDGVVLSGTPGVGKSCFLDFALHRLRADNKSVLYVHGKSGYAFIYKSDGNVEKVSITDAISGELAKTVDFILLDPPEGGDPNFWGYKNLYGKKFVLAVSPDRNNCQGLRKDASTVDLYMGGLLSIQDAEEMRLACYPNVPQSIVERRFEDFGGVPRLLFKPYDSSLPDPLQTAREEQDQALLDAISHPRRIDNGHPAQSFKSLWKLYHMHPIVKEDGTRDYSAYTIRPCCDDAGVRLRDKLMEKNVSDLWAAYSDTDKRLGALQGIRFEAYAHKKILVEGLNCSALGLTQTGLSSAGPVAVFVPPNLTRVDLVNNDVGQGLQDVVATARQGVSGSYLLPHFSNFPVVDSIFVPHGQGSAIQLQMKAGKSRPLSALNVAAITAATGNSSLYFVVPDEVTITKKLAGSNMNQYRIVLNEN